MTNWQNRIDLRHLITKKEDHKSVQTSMDAIADAIDASPFFNTFRTVGFRSIPENGILRPVECANILMDRMYDYADEHRIWINL